MKGQILSIILPFIGLDELDDQEGNSKLRKSNSEFLKHVESIVIACVYMCSEANSKGYLTS